MKVIASSKSRRHPRRSRTSPNKFSTTFCQFRTSKLMYILKITHSSKDIRATKVDETISVNFFQDFATYNHLKNSNVWFRLWVLEWYDLIIPKAWNTKSTKTPGNILGTTTIFGISIVYEDGGRGFVFQAVGNIRRHDESLWVKSKVYAFYGTHKP